jgi:NADPH:quinone reductase
MKALRVHSLGELPSVDEVDDPTAGPGQSTIRMVASALNPIDCAVAAGTFYAGHPPLPFVVGSEAVGVVESSAVWPTNSYVWAAGGGLGTQRDGTVAERVVIDDNQAEPIPSQLEPDLAAALGIAGLTGWLAVRYRARLRRDDRILILGATGTVGLVAIQAARLAGARVIAAVGRSAAGLDRARAFGATSWLALDDVGHQTNPQNLAACLQEITDGGPDVIIDALWGEVGQAALLAAAPEARMVQLGQSAGSTAEVASAQIRGKQLNVLGFSIFGTPAEIRGAEYAALTRAALLGDISVPRNVVSLSDSSLAWTAAAGAATTKTVICSGYQDPKR